MATIVVDTTAVIAIIANEAHKPAIVAATAGADVIAPSSLPWEIGNAFSAMFKKGRILPAQAQDALGLFWSLPIRLTNVSLNDCVQLAADLGIYAYDAYMIRCAIETAAPLLTLDGAMKHHAKRVGVQIIEVTP